MPRPSGAFALALLLSVATGNAAAAEESYVTDPAHSQPSYEIRHTIFSTQRGEFTKSTAKIIIDREAKKGSIDVTIDTASIRSHDPRLDAILKGVARDAVVPIALTKDASGNSVAEVAFTIKRLDYRIGDADWADPDTVANDVIVRVRMVLPPVR